MKVDNKLFTVALFCLFFVTCSYLRAQVQFSPQANRLLRKIEKKAANKNDAALGLDPAEIKFFNLKNRNGTYQVGGLIKITENVVEQELKKLGIEIRSKAGNIWTVNIPLMALASFKQLSGIEYFEIDQPYKLLLDKARITTRVNLVHEGFNLPSKYLGQNVIIGIIDGGFDFLHPTFRDTTGQRYRIISYWNQGAKEGTPPEGFDYGAEYTTEAQLRSIKSDMNQSITTATHATHVAGIAAGSGYGSGIAFRGIAPEADIIAVTPSLSTDTFPAAHSEILDAVQYVVSKAKKLNKPCVVNMSFGGLLEAMDGNSLLEKGLENITNENSGVVLVAGAGNSGNIAGHLKKTFNNDEITTIPVTLPMISEFLKYLPQRISIWGEEGEDFEVQMELINVQGQTQMRFPSFRVSSPEPLDTFALVDKDTIYLYMEGITRAAINNKPFLSITIINNVPININNPLDLISKLRFFKMKIKAASGTIHAWNVGPMQGLPFSNRIPFVGTPVPGTVAGDNNYMILTPGTSRGVITVGAYTTKNEYKDYKGNTRKIQMSATVGDIAPFSSRGPTHDGRTKPEITAPGNVIASAVSARDPSVADSIIVKFDIVNGDTAKYAVYEGTSMATPMVGGIAALLLQANRNLNFTQIKNIIISTAIKDEFTGSIPNGGSNTWGWGKIDAYAAIRSALGLSSVEYTQNKIARSALVYPNPSTGFTNLQLENFAGSVLQLRLVDLQGKIMWQEQISPTTHYSIHPINFGEIAPGLYFLHISDTQGLHSIKILIQ
ncbi:MAG: S8 family peptidase [Bacteroidia bacterium]|nr:S8 family peptidase [Bacteroidia bacterium]MDW8158202.1 S8 family peptidase [Bacteroidia bacterium]